MFLLLLPFRLGMLQMVIEARLAPYGQRPARRLCPTYRTMPGLVAEQQCCPTCCSRVKRRVSQSKKEKAIAKRNQTNKTTLRTPVRNHRQSASVAFPRPVSLLLLQSVFWKSFTREESIVGTIYLIGVETALTATCGALYRGCGIDLSALRLAAM